MAFDFDSLQRDMVAALVRAVPAWRAAHPEQQLYAFALTSSDDRAGVGPELNTRQALDAALQAQPEDDPDELAAKQWSPDELGDLALGLGAEEFQTLHMRLAEHVWELGPIRGWLIRRRVDRFMLDVLAAADEAGAFGGGAEREAVTLFVHLTDCNASLKLQNKAVRRLNPPAVAEAYFASLPPRWRV
jgi:hypothetical protein